MTMLDSLRDRLTDVLAELDEIRSLTISRTGSINSMSEEGSNRFVQFALFGPRLRAESVGDRYLVGRDRLTPEQHATLLDLGWSPPDDIGNYWAEWTVPAPCAEVADLGLATLASVHGVGHVEQLEFSGFHDQLEVPTATEGIEPWSSDRGNGW